MWLVPALPARPLLVIWSPRVVGPRPSSAASPGDLEPLCGWSLPLQRSLSWGSRSPRVVGPCPSSAASPGDLEPLCGWSLPFQRSLSWGSWSPCVVGPCPSSAAFPGELEPPCVWSLPLQRALRWPPLTCCAHTVPSSVLTPQALPLQAFAHAASFRPHVAGSLSCRSFQMSPL